MYARTDNPAADYDAYDADIQRREHAFERRMDQMAEELSDSLERTIDMFRTLSEDTPDETREAIISYIETTWNHVKHKDRLELAQSLISEYYSDLYGTYHLGI